VDRRGLRDVLGPVFDCGSRSRWTVAAFAIGVLADAHRRASRDRRTWRLRRLAFTTVWLREH